VWVFNECIGDVKGMDTVNNKKKDEKGNGRKKGEV